MLFLTKVETGSPPDLNLKAPPFHYQDPKRNTLDLLGIYFAQGTATFSCDTGCGMPSGAEAKCPAKWQHLEATLYDVGDRLHQDNDFAVKFLNRQTDGSDYLSTLEPGAPTGEIGRMTDNGPGPTIQLGDQVVFRTRINSGWMYSQPGSGPNGGTGRGWYQWGNSEVETGISDLYEVKTWGGDISDILCPTTKGQASAPYRSQLWLYGPRMNVALSGAITKPICDK